jgi:hypothetical protein
MTHRPKEGSGRAPNGAPLAFLRAAVAADHWTTTCIVWPYTVTNRGYPAIWHEGKQRNATHVALELAGHPRPAAAMACHRCDVRRCVKPSHLYWGDAATNGADKHQRARAPRGERHPMVKLTEAQVIAVRARHADGATVGELAREHQVSRGAITRIVHRRTWRHLP